MTNRASTVRSSTPRALNANACSFGSSVGSAAMPGTTPSAAATAMVLRTRRTSRVPSVPCFGTDPVKIAQKPMMDGDRDDLRKFVRVAGDDRSLDGRITTRPRLDRDGRFFRSFDFAAPVIE